MAGCNGSRSGPETAGAGAAGKPAGTVGGQTASHQAEGPGFGVRLDTYAHAPAELTGAIDRLLADEALHARLATTSKRLQSRPGTVAAADRIQALRPKA